MIRLGLASRPLHSASFALMLATGWLLAPTALAALPEPTESPELQRPSVPEPAEAEPEPAEAGLVGTSPADSATEAPGSTDTPSPADAASEPELGATPPPRTASCPCDELDWMCRQNNEAACPGSDGASSPEPATSSPAATASAPSMAATPRPTYRPRPEEPEPEIDLDPRGLVLELGAGLGGCRQDLCDLNPISILGRAAIGYRLPRIAFVANMSVGGGPKTDDEGGVLLVQADAGIELFLASTERVDPYVGAGLGTMQLVETNANYMTEDPADLYRYSRGMLRVAAGMPFRLSRGWSIGPRFDYAWGLLGRRCFSGSCTPISEIVDEASDSDAVTRRQERASFPRPWSLMLELRRQF